jgi:acyl-[acyl-carrier-protein]-phospholipid O-acyltransferase/long-chain-fatty-acid--[acyl-carrier-protein] ligase
MYQNLQHLLRTRRFLPLFVTQFLGALNDNLFKNALVFLVIFGLAESAAEGKQGQIIVTVAGGLLVVPFFLFSATAGQLADKLEKSRLIRRVKLAEIAIMILAAVGFLLAPTHETLKVYALMAVLFLMGTQSAFFGPLKYSILPDHLREEELVGGNGLVEAATFIAILIGTIAGGLLIVMAPQGEVMSLGPLRLALDGPSVVSLCLILIAMSGWAASFFIPRAGPADPSVRINRNLISETWRVIGHARADHRVFLAILGISWFWLVGFTLLTQFPAFVQSVLGAKEDVATLFLTLFSVGIAIGSLLTNRLLKGAVSAKYVPLGALGMSLAVLAVFLLTREYQAGAEPVAWQDFLAQPYNWLIVAALLATAIFGGLYIVPLYAIMQHFSAAEHRARVVAANNVLNAAFMVVSSLAASAMLAMDLTVPQVFLTVAVINFGVAVYICKLLPEAVVKPLIAGLLRLLYRVEVRGLENYAKCGPRAVIVANHVSFLDGLLLAAFLPEKPTFAIDTHMAKRWWVGPFLTLIEFYPMDPTKPLSTRSLIKIVGEGRHCVIFPEGRLTVTGALMKVYEGPGMIADKADADLLPVRIDGAQFTPLSRLKGKLRLRWFPKITVTILEPQRFTVDESLRGRKRREAIGEKLYDIMCEVVFRTCDWRRTLFQAVLDAGATHGFEAEIVDDIDRRALSYRRLSQASFALGHRLAGFTEKGEAVGLLLPSASATAVTFLALQAYGRVPAMLNFTAGSAAMEAACRTAEVRHVISSRRFVQAAKLEEPVQQLSRDLEIHYLEDLREEIGLMGRLYGLAARAFAEPLHQMHVRPDAASPDEPAVILFTSGSEGMPKAVVLSHANILANAFQLGARVDFNPTDIVFNALPLFHSFGLSSGLILPLVSGVKTFLYPSPLHYRIIPELVYATNATIFYGTDTFLAGYARVAHPYDFYSLRYVFAGAEKVKDQTRQTWIDKFGLRIIEGYGATEASPVIATNTPMHWKAGTVGRLLPGIEHRLEPVPGIDDGGRLWVSGPNIMLGYYRGEAPGRLEPPADGWYDTGDIVDIDERGFITIKGRAKRFAKVAGEMISLTAIEDAAAKLWPGAAVAAINLPDERKGEQIVLLTDCGDASRESFLAHAGATGLPELMVPRKVYPGQEVPLLGSGKIDYGRAQAVAEDLLSGRLPGLRA